MYKKGGGGSRESQNSSKVSAVLALLGVAIMLCSVANETLFVVGAVVASTCFIPHFLFNRCPHCRKLLGNNGAEHCQYCGKPIEYTIQMIKAAAVCPRRPFCIVFCCGPAPSPLGG